MTPATPVPAATLVLFRDRDGAPPELLMMERAAVMAFAAGALVFPGGRVDPGDRILAGDAEDRDDAAARVAAIRETIEESGIAVGFDPVPTHEQIAAIRAGLAQGRSFGEILDEGGWRLDLDSLVPWARWCPNMPETRVFDARFYLARLPDGAPDATADETENTRLLWIDAAALLEQADRGDAHMIFPTRRNLDRLAQFASFDEAAAHGAAIPIALIQPFVEDRGGEAFLCIPEGLGYPITAEPLSTALRG